MSDVSEARNLTAEEVSAITRQTNYGTWRFQKSWKPLFVADAEGCWFSDGGGKRPQRHHAGLSPDPCARPRQPSRPAPPLYPVAQPPGRDARA